MLNKELSVAIVNELCPICCKVSHEFLIMNERIGKKYAEEIEKVNGKSIGFSKDACKECLKYKDDAVFCIAIDANKSTSTDPYRTGQIVGIRKDFQLFIDNPQIILKTNNGVSYCFVEETVGKQIGFFK